MQFEEWWEKESGWGGEMLAEGQLAKAAWTAALFYAELECAKNTTLPNCMMPDAGFPCTGYYEMSILHNETVAAIREVMKHMRNEEAGVLRLGLWDNDNCRQALKRLFDTLPEALDDQPEQE
jgi:hypothetical protein